MVTMARRTGAEMPDEARWRTRDIVVAAIIGVVFGVVFLAWNSLWSGLAPVFSFALPARNLVYGVWLMPAVLAPLIIRKPGAALFAEMVAAALSALLGVQWGADTLLSGFVQGAAAELVFAFTLYRVYSPVVLVVAAIASAAGAWIHDWVVWYPDVSTDTQLLVGLFMAVSAIVVTAGGSIALERSLRRAGVLEGFPT